ncbi:MAG: phage tail family protein, partial [Ruminococcus sp.]|nr:phage tail family protein [Ruminococcus sp.]
GDIIRITTKTGGKTVTLERNGVTENIINRLVSGSAWLNLCEGENTFILSASDGFNNLKVRLIHRNAYLGV